MEAAIERRRDTRGDRFNMTVDGVRHAKRVDAGDHLRRVASALVNAEPGRDEGGPVGDLAGFEVHAAVDRRFDEVLLTIPDIAAEVRWPITEWRDVEPSSVVQRLERRVQGLDTALTEAQADLAAATQEAHRAQARLGTPFEHDEEIRRLRRRQQEINEQLTAPEPEPVEPLPAQRMAARLDALGRSTAPASSRSLGR